MSERARAAAELIMTLACMQQEPWAKRLERVEKVVADAVAAAIEKEQAEEIARLRAALTDIAHPDIGTFAHMCSRALSIAQTALRPGGAPREGASK